MKAVERMNDAQMGEGEQNSEYEKGKFLQYYVNSSPILLFQFFLPVKLISDT